MASPARAAASQAAGPGTTIAGTHLSQKKATNFIAWAAAEECQSLYHEYLDDHIAHISTQQAADSALFWTANLPVATAWTVSPSSQMPPPPPLQQMYCTIMELRAIPMSPRMNPTDPWKLLTSSYGRPIYCAFAFTAAGELREHQLFELAMRPDSNEGDFVPIPSEGEHCPDTKGFRILSRKQRIDGSMDNLPPRFVVVELDCEKELPDAGDKFDLRVGGEASSEEWEASSDDNGESAEKGCNGTDVAGPSKRTFGGPQLRCPSQRAIANADHGERGGLGASGRAGAGPQLALDVAHDTGCRGRPLCAGAGSQSRKGKKIAKVEQPSFPPQRTIARWGFESSDLAHAGPLSERTKHDHLAWEVSARAEAVLQPNKGKETATVGAEHAGAQLDGSHGRARAAELMQASKEPLPVRKTLPPRCHPCYPCVPCKHFWGVQLPVNSFFREDRSRDLSKSLLSPEEDVPPSLPEVEDDEFEESKQQKKAAKRGRKTRVKYYGVSSTPRTSTGFWVARQRIQEKQYFMGAYATEELAARAYDKAELIFKNGESMNFNPIDYKEEYPFLFRLSWSQMRIYLRREAVGRGEEVKYPGVHLVMNRKGEPCFQAFYFCKGIDKSFEHLKQYKTEEEAVRAAMEAALQRKDYELAGMIMDTHHVRTISPAARSSYEIRGSGNAQLQDAAPESPPTAPPPGPQPIPVRTSESRRNDVAPEKTTVGVHRPEDSPTAVVGSPLSTPTEIQPSIEPRDDVPSPTPSLRSRLPIATDNAALANARPAYRSAYRSRRNRNGIQAMPPFTQVVLPAEIPFPLQQQHGPEPPSQVSEERDVARVHFSCIPEAHDEEVQPTQARITVPTSDPLPPAVYPTASPALTAPGTDLGILQGPSPQLATWFQQQRQELENQQWQVQLQLCELQRQQWSQALQAYESKVQPPPAEVVRQWEQWQCEWQQKFLEWQFQREKSQLRSFTGGVTSPCGFGNLPGPSQAPRITPASKSQEPGFTPWPPQVPAPGRSADRNFGSLSAAPPQTPQTDNRSSFVVARSAFPTAPRGGSNAAATDQSFVSPSPVNTTASTGAVVRPPATRESPESLFRRIPFLEGSRPRE